MLDPRLTKLADLLINYSTRIQPGEHLLIEAFDLPEEMVVALIRACREAGGHAHAIVRNNRIMRALVGAGKPRYLAALAERLCLIYFVIQWLLDLPHRLQSRLGAFEAAIYAPMGCAV